ncbi:MAG TPA: ParA family protein [Rhodospirillaceae bacterium]|nr:chromosome partitioning protein ParA [Rhodospirillaceae bacterium]MAX61875.1 chromosome partitioning protein ParA [Rhodospirillaceae bacterium]HBM11223.1 ParA family protein [Rhodospirillaceae bacterium]|tara:strand:+ start:458 stop:1186 length:729 start_codon:yes stop_codon:yes gene_type:complete
MPIIAFASPKGGAGKTTTCLQLAGELLHSGVDVTIVDADPNQPFKAWQEQSIANNILPKGLTILEGLDEAKLTDVIDAAAEKATFVLVDLEGSANMGVANAIGRADLVLIPIQGSRLDANQAQRSVGLVQQSERIFKRKIPHAILITKTSAAIRGTTLKTIIEDIRSAQVPVFKTELLDREIFKTLFDIGGTLYSVDNLEDPISGKSALSNARSNTNALTREVLALLQDPESMASAAKEDAA